jgi:hypothetical protein
MLLQFLRALVLSCLTKFGGNLKIREDDRPPPNDPRAPILPENRPALAPSDRGTPEKSGSERHSNDGKTLAKVEEDTAMVIVFFP